VPAQPVSYAVASQTWRTLDATPFSVVLAELPDNCIVNLYGMMSAATAAGVGWIFHGIRGAKRGTGSAILIGSAVVLADVRDAGAASWTITMGVSGNQLIATVTGAAATDITWGVTAFLHFTPLIQ
jgi:hypothetical protein